MSVEYLDVFRIAADCFQVLLGALIIRLLMRAHKKSAKVDGAAWPSGEANPFRHEFLLQSLKQQSEQTFDNIQKTLLSERGNLLRLYEIGDDQWRAGAADAPDNGSDPAPFQIGGGDSSDECGNPSDQYHRVAQLAVDGMDARRIAKHLGISQGEVELVLKLSAVSRPNFVLSDTTAAAPRRNTER